VTVRDNTERPVTVTKGTNVIVGSDMTQLQVEVNRAFAGGWRRGEVPPLWDGRAGPRIADAILRESL
jgi:UDP-N-acetylglucosamine 2-epimerase (non-hydrolysing)